MKTQITHSKLNIVPVFLLIAVIGAGPFILAAWDSFFHDYFGERSFAGLENFRIILSDKAFSFSLNITVVWAVLNAVLSILFGFLLALKLTEKTGRNSILYRSILIPWGIPIYIAIPLWRAFIHGNGGVSILTRLTGLQINLLTDPFSGFTGALIVSLWLGIPLSAFVFTGHIRKIPSNIIEAAKIDGAGKGEIALYLYLPEIRSSIMAMGILSFIKAFKEFTLVYMMTAGGPPLVSGITDRYIVGATTTLGVFLYEVFLQTNDWGINAAYAMVMGALVLFAVLLWIMIRKEVPLFWFILTAALTQLPGGTPVLWIISVLYLVAIPFPRYLKLIVPAHILYVLINISYNGFLSGFHPGVLTGLIVLLTLKFRKTENRTHGVNTGRPFLDDRKKGRILSAGSTGISWIFVITTLIIIYMLFWMSISRISACYVDSILPPMPTMDNFIKIFREEHILKYFLNTFFVSSVTAVLIPVLLFPAAVWLNSTGKTRTLIILAFIQILGIAGGMHSLIPLYKLFRYLRLINTYFPLFLIYLYHSIPVSLFILTAFMENIPSSYRDMALIEGISPARYTFSVLLPLSTAPLLTAVMSGFISAWNSFQAPLLFLNDEKLYTISLKLYSYVGNLGSGGQVWNLFAAVSVINTLFIGLIFLRFKNPMELSYLKESEE